VTALAAFDAWGLAAPRRLRRVNIARETSDRTVVSVLPEGYVRPATQLQWRTVMRDVLDVAPLRADRHATLVAVATALMSWADWDTLTTRPTWAKLIDRCQEATGRGSRATIARAIATLIQLNLIARVAHGRKGCYAPGDPASNPNEAAVYVLLVPSQLRAVPRADDVHASRPASSVDENETPPASRSVSEAHPARARGDLRPEPLRGPQFDVAAQAPPPPTSPANRHVELWPGSTTPGTDGARLSAAAELQRRLPVLRQISTRDVRACLREFFLAGWTVQDVHHALDWKPDGTRWPHDGANGVGPTGVRGWARYRLAPWTSDGTPRRSFGQRAAAERSEQLARQRAERERAEAARADTTSTPPAIVTAVRDHLRHVRWHQVDPACPWCAADANQPS
jgi:hypothetical protein